MKLTGDTLQGNSFPYFFKDRLIPTSEAATNPFMEAYLTPYLTELDAYDQALMGTTLMPINALEELYVRDAVINYVGCIFIQVKPSVPL